jgi:hypothetical protein
MCENASSLLRVVAMWSILVVGEGEASDDYETVLPWLCPVAVDTARRRLTFSDEGRASWKVVGGGGEERLE